MKYITTILALLITSGCAMTQTGGSVPTAPDYSTWSNYELCDQGNYDHITRYGIDSSEQFKQELIRRGLARPDYAKYVRQGKAATGMNMTEAKCVVGHPDDRNVSVAAGTKRYYWRYDPGITLIFNQDKKLAQFYTY